MIRLALVLLLCGSVTLAQAQGSSRTPNLRLKGTSDTATNDNFNKVDDWLGGVINATGAVSSTGQLSSYQPTASASVTSFTTETSATDNPQVTMYQASAVTGDGLPTMLLTRAATTDTSVLVQAQVRGRCRAGSGCTVGQVLGCSVWSTIKNVSGTASVVGTNTYDHCQSDITGLTCTTACAVVAGASCGVLGSYCVRVTGATDHTITWWLDSLTVREGAN